MSQAASARRPPARLRPEKLTGVAVVGTGSIGMRHLETLRRIEGLLPVAVPRRAERLAALREAGYTAATDLAEADAIGASCAIIATDTSRHVEDALAALERGWSVLVEKPLACDAREAAQITTRAAQLGRHVFVGCVLRFSESLNLLRTWLPRIGRVHDVRIECQSYLPEWRVGRPYRDSYSARAAEGGVLRDLIHDVDYAGWLFGWPAQVQARLLNTGRLGIDAEEMAQLTWRGPGGALVSVHLDYLTKPARRRMRVCGELGTLTWDGMAGTVSLSLTGAAEERVRPPGQLAAQLFEAQARAFLDAAAGQVDPRLTTGADGMRALAVCDAARQASASRCEMQVSA